MMTTLFDEETVLKAAFAEKDRETAEAKEAGRQEGRQEGEKIGLEKGRQESRQRIVKNMLKQKKSEEEIALLIGEPEETIRELIEQISSEVPEGDAD